jgi:hypothetical protein
MSLQLTTGRNSPRSCSAEFATVWYQLSFYRIGGAGVRGLLAESGSWFFPLVLGVLQLGDDWTVNVVSD